MYGDEEIVGLLKEIIRRLEIIETILKNQQKVPYGNPPIST
jgi:hypothetical protein